MIATLVAFTVALVTFLASVALLSLLVLLLWKLFTGGDE